MNNTLIVMNILYNPASYYDSSWLLRLTSTANCRDRLPDNVINYLLINHYCSTVFAPRTESISSAGWLLLKNWHQLHEVAWLLGLKCTAASLMQSPVFIQRLSPRQRSFFSSPLCLPSRMTLEATSQEQILEYGAQILFSAASQLLAADYLLRLRFIFPNHFNCETQADERAFPLAFAAVQQAMLYV